MTGGASPRPRPSLPPTQTMNELLPIIRRVRRPLVVENVEPPKVEPPKPESVKSEAADEAPKAEDGGRKVRSASRDQNHAPAGSRD